MELPDPNKKYPSETESAALIRFQDCDPLGHLNNAKYFDYFFNAREDQVQKIYGYSPGFFFKKYKCSWVVYNHNISYVRSAVFSEWVKIMSRVIHYDDDSAVVEYYMTDEAKKELKCLLWTTIKYVDITTGKRVAHQPEVTHFMEIMLAKGVQYEGLSIRNRVKEIKAELFGS